MARLYPNTIPPDLQSLNKKIEDELNELVSEIDNLSTATFVTAASGAPEISTTSLTVSSSLTEDVWTEVGPTGVGTVSWPALDSVPTGSDWVEIRIRMAGSVSGASADDYVYSIVYAAKGGTTPTLGDCIVSQIADRTNSSGGGNGGGVSTFRVMLSSTNTINLRWANEGWGTNSIVAHLVGYGVNN